MLSLHFAYFALVDGWETGSVFDNSSDQRKMTKNWSVALKVQMKELVWNRQRRRKRSTVWQLGASVVLSKMPKSVVLWRHVFPGGILVVIVFGVVCYCRLNESTELAAWFCHLSLLAKFTFRERFKGPNSICLSIIIQPTNVMYNWKVPMALIAKLGTLEERKHDEVNMPKSKSSLSQKSFIIDSMVEGSSFPRRDIKGDREDVVWGPLKIQPRCVRNVLKILASDLSHVIGLDRVPQILYRTWSFPIKHFSALIRSGGSQESNEGVRNVVIGPCSRW